MTSRHVYHFGGGSADGHAKMRDVLGGKGANLAEMSRIGLPVPPGFTIATNVCTYYHAHDGSYPAELRAEVEAGLRHIETIVGRKFGDRERPLLVSVRSGARDSMPGMMDTVLNLGLCEATLPGLIEDSGDRRFAFDSYRRLLQMYGNVVMGVDGDVMEGLLHATKERRGVERDNELTAEDWESLIPRFKAAIREHTGRDFPDDPMEQLWGGIGAVFKSWEIPRAREYRRIHRIPGDWGTAVNVQAMVFGNLGDDCATGVAFSRDPSSGENVFYGEYLINAQGEDVVAGIRTPAPINRAGAGSNPERPLEEAMPEAYRQLDDIRRRLEAHYQDMQDIEFTVERDKLWMLQTRSGKRTGFAALRIATDMVDEGLIDSTTAIRRVQPEQIVQLLSPIFDADEKRRAIAEERVVATGLNAGPGAATGKIVFTADHAVEWARRGEPVVLVRVETSPEDIHGMHVAEGVLTARGGMTSHAAVVARGMGKPCVVGCGALAIDYAAAEIKVGGRVLREGDSISIDGLTGEVIVGALTTRPSEILQVLIEKSLAPDEAPVYQQYARLMSWADEARRLRVRTNADTPEDAAHAVAFGAEGIGLCRTEHMFFDADRILQVRRMILAKDAEGRREALAKLLPMQREDFIGIFRAMEGRPVTIRTLDPPLHEFLPHGEAELTGVADSMGISVQEIQDLVANLSEANPMLGHRGCRLGIQYPEITEMQARAIFEAAVNVAREGIPVHPEVMIPLVSHANELALQRAVVERVAAEVIGESGLEIPYLIGTMIELPRAALTADRVAEHADFFSFGTNDLTQTTFGLSRDDAGKFLPDYVTKRILDEDPFVSIDAEGVGALVGIAVEKGRAADPGIKLGICGEHGGDPRSVVFCHSLGLDYVSCSPFRVPVARLAAARAVLDA